MTVQLNKSNPAKKNEIKGVENLLGSLLPRDYYEFLLKHNGAKPEPNVFDDDLVVSVDCFIPISEVAKFLTRVEGFPADAFPIAEAPSGNFIYLKRNAPDVFFWDHEIENDKKLASSFSEFLEGLRPLDIDSIQLKPGQVESVWIDPDFKPEFD